MGPETGNGAALVLPADAPSVQLEADTHITSPSGAVFEAAGGWFVSSREGRVILEDPDREATVVLLTVDAPDGEDAIARAWAGVQPGFSRTIRHTMHPPARDGWDEIVQLIYETATDERRTVVGAARRKGATWHVALIDGFDAVLDRRGAQLQTVLVSYKAPGMEVENFAGRPAHPLDAERLADFAAFVEEARRAADVPGAAIAIVQNGGVVFEQGFGVRELGGEQPVTPNTLFLIGSTTKSLTTLMMAALVDEGRLRWDQPVADVLPGFALADPDVTRRVTMRHTVCACTGLPRQDMEFLFEYSDATPESMVALMRTMAPTTGFGETFQYSNPLVSSGGYAAAQAAFPGEPLGAAYDGAMRTRVFEPLGMTATTFDFSAAASTDHAEPHGMDLRSETSPLPLEIERALIPVRPAGGAWSSASEMSRYIAMELARGVAPSGERVVSEENLLHRWDPQVRITDEVSYGLGLFVDASRGIRTIHHGGNTLGFTSDLLFFPEHGVGAVILANAGGANSFRSAVRRRLLEILFDGRDEARANLEYSLQQRETYMAKVIEEIVFSPDSSWLEPLVGVYANPDLGRVQVRLAVSGAPGAGSVEAILDAGEWQSPVAMRRVPDGTESLILTGAPLAGLELRPGSNEGRSTLTLELAQQRYTFERVE